MTPTVEELRAEMARMGLTWGDFRTPNYPGYFALGQLPDRQQTTKTILEIKLFAVSGYHLHQQMAAVVDTHGRFIALHKMLFTTKAAMHRVMIPEYILPNGFPFVDHHLEWTDDLKSSDLIVKPEDV